MIAVVTIVSTRISYLIEELVQALLSSTFNSHHQLQSPGKICPATMYVHVQYHSGGYRVKIDSPVSVRAEVE